MTVLYVLSQIKLKEFPEREIADGNLALLLSCCCSQWQWKCEVLVTDVVWWLCRLVHSPCNWQELFSPNKKLQQPPPKVSLCLAFTCVWKIIKNDHKALTPV